MQAKSRHVTARRLKQVGVTVDPASLAHKREAGRRLAVLVTVAAASTMVVTAAAVASPRPAGKTTAPRQQSWPAPATAQPLPASALTLTPLDRESCPATATACVDLTRHLSWLQSGGHITFGPVQAEPGPPGSAHATPRGTFRVSWKAGANFVSNIYNEPMPWPVFFAPGGIAFHGGSLTIPSHGCVHLTSQNARYYNDHLTVGAEVVVF